MTQREWDAIQALQRCRYLPGSWQKRFVRWLATIRRDTELSPTTVERLWRLAASWRKQLPLPVVQSIPFVFQGGLSQSEMVNGELSK
jgi:hypothetical protein